jgi:hypothetical protein
VAADDQSGTPALCSVAVARALKEASEDFDDHGHAVINSKLDK